MMRTVFVHKLRFCLLKFTPHAVLHLVATLVNVALLFTARPKLLRSFFVSWIARANKVRVGEIERRLECIKLRGILIAIRLWIFFLRNGALVNLLSMFVRPCVKDHLATFGTLGARQHVRLDNLKRKTNMRLCVHVRQCSGDVVTVHIGETTITNSPLMLLDSNFAVTSAGVPR